MYFSNFGSIEIIDNASCLQKILEFVKRLYLAYGLILFSIPNLVVSAINTEHALAVVQLLVPTHCKSETDLQRSFLPIYTAPNGADRMHPPIPSVFPDSCHEIPDAIFCTDDISAFPTIPDLTQFILLSQEIKPDWP